MELIISKLAFIFDPTPDTSFVLQNHFMYLFIAGVVLGLFLVMKKKDKKKLGYVIRNYSILGLVFLAMRYENMIFFSMRAIFALFIVGAATHITFAWRKVRKSQGVSVETLAHHTSSHTGSVNSHTSASSEEKAYKPQPKKHGSKKNKHNKGTKGKHRNHKKK